MDCLKFPQSNTNLTPKLKGGHPVFHPESGLIPAHKNFDTGVTMILLQFTPEELNLLRKTKGKFFLTFSNQNNIASIQDHIGPAELVADLLEDSEDSSNDARKDY